MKKIIPELKRVGDSIIFDGDYLDIYIPVKLFDIKLAEYNGEYISTLGNFIFEIKTEKQVTEGKQGRINKLTIPNTISFQYSNSYKYKGSLEKYPEDEYNVFRLERGNQFIANVNLQQKSSEVVNFVKALHGGSLPKSLSYDEILSTYHKVLELNSVSLNAPSLIYELTIAEVCRDKKDSSRPFRKAVNEGNNVSKYDYTSISLNKLPMLNSTFGGLTFENINDAIIKSLDRTEVGGKEAISPIEKNIRY